MTTQQITAAITVVSVPVSDQDRARAFYVDRLGFELVRDDSSLPGLRWMQVRPVGSATALTLVDWFDSMPAGSLRGLVLAVDDLRATYEHLVQRGVEFDAPPKQQPWATEAVLRDPDGNELVLQQGMSGFAPAPGRRGRPRAGGHIGGSGGRCRPEA